MVITMSRAYDRLHVLRDPTRGGATTLNKIAEPSERNVVIHQFAHTRSRRDRGCLRDPTTKNVDPNRFSREPALGSYLWVNLLPHSLAR